ncbi:MAG: type II secretion system protein [bacterium]|jgi:general secretion pathway protein G
MSRARRNGFTLIELLVVLAIIGLLLTLTYPRYFQTVDRSRETILRENLRTVREVIDKFYADVGRYPQTIEEMVERGYLREAPVDPLTESAATWRVIAPPSGREGLVYDIKSGAPGNGADGKPYADW